MVKEFPVLEILSLEFGASLLLRRHPVPDMLNFLVNSAHHTMEDRTSKKSNGEPDLHTSEQEMQNHLAILLIFDHGIPSADMEDQVEG